MKGQITQAQREFAERLMKSANKAGQRAPGTRGHTTADANRGYIDGSKASRYAGARSWNDTFR